MTAPRRGVNLGEHLREGAFWQRGMACASGRRAPAHWSLVQLGEGVARALAGSWRGPR